MIGSILLGFILGSFLLFFLWLAYSAGRDQGRHDEHMAWRGGRCLHGYTGDTL